MNTILKSTPDLQPEPNYREFGARVAGALEWLTAGELFVEPVQFIKQMYDMAAECGVTFDPDRSVEGACSPEVTNDGRNRA